MTKLMEKAGSLLQLTLGTVLTAAAFGMIIVPMNFTAAGVTGFAMVLNTFLPCSLSLLVLIINLLFLLLGFLFFGKDFLVRTVIYSLLFPFLLDFFEGFRLTSIEADPLVCVILAGVLLGTGSGLVIRCGASTGGFAIPALILNKKLKISVGTAMNVLDALVIVTQLLTKSPLQTVYGILTVTISALIADRIVSLGRGEAQITVISPQNSAIRVALLEHADVGLTSFLAETGYRQDRQAVIVTVVPYMKVPEARRIIMGIDPTAFVIIAQVQSVLGKGYTLSR